MNKEDDLEMIEGSAIDCEDEVGLKRHTMGAGWRGLGWKIVGEAHRDPMQLQVKSEYPA